MLSRTRPAGLLALAAFCSLSGAAVGQASVSATPATLPRETSRAADAEPAWLAKLGEAPAADARTKYLEQQKARRAAEKELRRLRAQYFVRSRNPELRQEGMLKLRAYTDPALFPAMIEIFENDDLEVRSALLDHFLEQQTDEADAALAWVGVFDRDAEVRDAAADRLRTRLAKAEETPEAVKLVVYEGLRSECVSAQRKAAEFADALSIVEVIPWLIAGQVGAPTGGGAQTGRSSNSSLGWIMVGTQTAFISDLEPVVGPAAVAFDPQLGVVTEGVVLRVTDAAVVQYNVDFHNALVGMSERIWGQPTRQLGWDRGAWEKWYKDEFKPFLAQQKAAQTAAAQLGATPSGHNNPTAPPQPQ